MTDEGPVSSADQDAWLEIIRSIRIQLAKHVPNMAEMDGANLKAFMEAVTEARYLNERTLYMDKSVEQELNRLPFAQD